MSDVHVIKRVDSCSDKLSTSRYGDISLDESFHTVLRTCRVSAILPSESGGLRIRGLRKALLTDLLRVDSIEKLDSKQREPQQNSDGAIKFKLCVADLDPDNHHTTGRKHPNSWCNARACGTRRIRLCRK